MYATACLQETSKIQKVHAYGSRTQIMYVQKQYMKQEPNQSRFSSCDCIFSWTTVTSCLLILQQELRTENILDQALLKQDKKQLKTKFALRIIPIKGYTSKCLC